MTIEQMLQEQNKQLQEILDNIRDIRKKQDEVVNK